MTLRHPREGYKSVVESMTCEICGKQVALKDAHSMIVVVGTAYAMPGEGKPGYQCPNEQHYGCCYSHAVEAAITCLMHHLEVGAHVREGDQGFSDQVLEQVKEYLKKHVDTSNEEI